MPTYRCRHSGCPALLSASGWCPAHAADGERHQADRQKFYDQHARDPAAKTFYNSAAWQQCRDAVLAEHPTCQRCGRTWSAHVHHTKPLAQCDAQERLDKRLLLALCGPCHNIVEREAKLSPAVAVEPRPFVAGTLHPVEDDRYYFDADAAERPIRFIAKYVRLYEGVFAGRPLELLDWQQQIIRTLFGWKHRDTGLRRFRELYIISAKGAGKTPFLAAIALYMLLRDGEAAPHVVSMASTFEQANLTFAAGKAYIREHRDLWPHVVVKQYAITTAKGYGKWTTISGKPTGRSGPRPSCVVADEVHEWPGATAQTFNLLTANLFKRAQPLLLVATNAGNSRSSFAYQLHDRATKVLSGQLADDTLLPVIFEAPADLQWDSEAAAAAANPSLGKVVQWSQLASAVARARESQSAQAEYRRLYLTQWATGGANKWLSMDQWSAATAPVDPETLKTTPLFVGLDLSQGDDLCAAVYVWATAERYSIRSRFWLPRATADGYQKSEGHPYREWEAAGAITLLTETTITPETEARIVADVLADVAGHRVKAVAYDTYRAGAVIAALEAAGLTCIPVRQGFTLYPGCVELERRLTAGTITVDPNPVLLSHAETVEVQADARGNYWPRKPNAKDKYKGRAGAKIDGIAALVTAITEAKRREAKPEPKKWDGSIRLK